MLQWLEDKVLAILPAFAHLLPWLAGIKNKGSEIVVVAYADPRSSTPPVGLMVTRQQSQAVCDYLKAHHKVQKLGWFSSRNVIPLGLGTQTPPLPETEILPPDRIEVQVFLPQT